MNHTFQGEELVDALIDKCPSDSNIAKECFIKVSQAENPKKKALK